MNFEGLSFKEIKEKMQDVSIQDLYNDESMEKVLESLISDKRKNVSAFGKKLEKQKNEYAAEIQRVKAMYEFDKSFGSYKYVAGVDEVGRGPLAGPIVACAVMLDLNVLEDDLILYLNDSKKVKESKREELAEIIKEKALCYHIALSSNEEIDKKGIAYSNNKVFLDSCNNLEIKPDLVLSDGYLVKNIEIENKSVIKGDTKSACIAAASIVAKVYRDHLMKEYAKQYPQYDFENNVGYGTGKHIEAIKQFGMTPIHRNSFLSKLL